MKTLLLSEIFPPRTGGTGRWFWEVWRRLPADHFAVCAGETPGADTFDRTHQLDLVRAPMTFSDLGLASSAGLTAYWRAARALGRAVAERGVEHVYCARLVPEGWVALMLRASGGPRFTCFVQGEEANLESAHLAGGMMSSRQLRAMSWLVARTATGMIANSRNSARIMTEQWKVPAERVVILHPGCDTTYFTPAARDAEARRALGWGDRPVLLTAGRLQKRKGHDMMIRALSRVRQAAPDVLFAVVGNGEERAALEQLVLDEGQQDHVRFHGEVSDQQLRLAYQQADLFVLANRAVGSDIEGFGMVLLESQACGRPVLAGDSGGTAETMIRGTTGDIVDCTDPGRLAERIVHLLSDRPRLDAMGLAGRTWVVEHFDWVALGREAEGVFTAMATGRPTKA